MGEFMLFNNKKPWCSIMKMFNKIMLGLLIISVVFTFLAPLYCSQKELSEIVKNLAGCYMKVIRNYIWV